VRAIETVPEAMLRAPTTFIAASQDDLTRALDVQASRPRATALAIDLIGHSTRDHQLLRLGSTVIDALDRTVMRSFEDLARSGVLQDINAVCLRLLGCATAVTPSGQRTMRTLTSLLEIPVYGSRKRLSCMHHNEHGFDPRFGHVLVEAVQRRSPWLQLGAPAPGRVSACAGG
jgi:hypothetical protein